METYCVEKADSLQGEVDIQGSKNAVLPMMAACVLHKGTTVLKGCPDIKDVRSMCTLLAGLGCRVCFEKGILQVDATDAHSTAVAGEAAGAMRSSIILAGALLGRYKEATLAYPGGCLIGKRPIDIHLAAFQTMGVQVEEKETEICCKGEKMAGATVTFRFPSVGATENIILAAVLTPGITKICNAAREPEILALCHMLQEMGAKITGAGSRTIQIKGVESLHDCQVRVPSDRIVTGTYLCAVAGCGGMATLRTDCAASLMSVYPVLEKLGCHVTCTDSYITIAKQKKEEGMVQFKTGVYPEFPTDLQPQMMAVLCRSEGYGIIIEEIFENRFAQVDQLQKMGADISVIDNIAVIKGREKLKGAEVVAYDLRGGAAMVLAGMLAEGTTQIQQISYIQRGYEDICRDLNALGAQCLSSARVPNDGGLVKLGRS